MNNYVLGVSIIFFAFIFINYQFSFNFFKYTGPILGVFIEWLFFLVPIYWAFRIMFYFKKNKLILVLFFIFSFLYFLALIYSGVFSYGFEVILKEGLSN